MPQSTDPSALIAQRLLKGWCLTNDYCTSCRGLPLMRSKAGEVICVGCQSDVSVPASSPATKPAAPAVVESPSPPASAVVAGNTAPPSSSFSDAAAVRSPAPADPPRYFVPETRMEKTAGATSGSLAPLQQALLGRLSSYQRALNGLSDQINIEKEKELMSLIVEATNALRNVHLVSDGK
eukprot:CAMPEP_0204270154 /NCGR_PEP_ID=MMETSP0468-20130131/18322_1 /ASSEMBLY_ACC=CAM_ASM_000383 /TAXON_ID=2969 /ORGANISM="Oxyrrhis marina" /LENGTH=179 /DNA_ID=CAMNT_0051245647 /DNA_START=30 /DNA_END=569 /DNA_ORIENTATION=+